MELPDQYPDSNEACLHFNAKNSSYFVDPDRSASGQQHGRYNIEQVLYVLNKLC